MDLDKIVWDIFHPVFLRYFNVCTKRWITPGDLFFSHRRPFKEESSLKPALFDKYKETQIDFKNFYEYFTSAVDPHKQL